MRVFHDEKLVSNAIRKFPLIYRNQKSIASCCKALYVTEIVLCLLLGILCDLLNSVCGDEQERIGWIRFGLLLPSDSSLDDGTQ